MKSNSKLLGDIIAYTDERNIDNATTEVLGISINKEFMTSVANIIGTDLSKYKILRKGRFAFNSMHTGRDEKLPIALYKKDSLSIVSPAYFMFEIKDKTNVCEDYLMIWFQRPEFDHLCWLMTDASVRGGLSWEDFCRIRINLPTIDEQVKIVYNYKIIIKRIELLEKINQKYFSFCDNYFHKLMKETDSKEYSLDLLCNIIYGKNLLTKELTDNGYFVYGGNGIIGRYSKYLYDRRMVIISCRGAASGKVMYTEPYSFITSNSLVLEINNEEKTPFEFMFFSCYNTNFYSKVSGSAQPQLTIENLRDIKIKVPSNEIVCKFIKVTRNIFNQIELINKEIGYLKNILQQILNKLH